MRQIRWKSWLWLPLLAVVVGVSTLAEEPSPGEGKKPLMLGKAPVIRFPGESFRGALPKRTEDEAQLAKDLRKHVEKLASDIGERNLREYEHLTEAASWLEKMLAAFGYEVERQSFKVDDYECHNLIVERTGKTHPEEVVIVGAHYDSALGAPGANDNGSGTAALLELSKRFAKLEPGCTLRLVFFVNEEPPHFQSDTMGSLVYARRCKERKENITAVLSLETIGYYSDEEGSQKYPPPLGAVFPKTGNFVGFVGNVDSGPLVHRVLSSFRKHTMFPSEATSLPGAIQGVGWSDQWSFWEFGYQGVMVTDTAPFRYPHYHRPTDTPDKLDYDRMSRVVVGLEKAILDLVNPHEQPADKTDSDNKLIKKNPLKKIKLKEGEKSSP